MNKLIDIINTNNQPNTIENIIESHELINWRKVGLTLAGHPEAVRSTYSGKKYKQAVDELKQFVAQWMATYSKLPDTAKAGGQKIENNLQNPSLNEPEQL